MMDSEATAVAATVVVVATSELVFLDAKNT
jgi:hypothetical protein